MKPPKRDKTGFRANLNRTMGADSKCSRNRLIHLKKPILSGRRENIRIYEREISTLSTLTENLLVLMFR